MKITVAGQKYEKTRTIATGDSKDAACVITIDNLKAGNLEKTFTGSASYYHTLEKQLTEAINDAERKFQQWKQEEEKKVDHQIMIWKVISLIRHSFKKLIF